MSASSPLSVQNNLTAFVSSYQTSLPCSKISSSFGSLNHAGVFCLFVCFLFKIQA